MRRSNGHFIHTDLEKRIGVLLLLFLPPPPPPPLLLYYFIAILSVNLHYIGYIICTLNQLYIDLLCYASLMV